MLSSLPPIGFYPKDSWLFQILEWLIRHSFIGNKKNRKKSVSLMSRLTPLYKISYCKRQQGRTKKTSSYSLGSRDSYLNLISLWAVIRKYIVFFSTTCQNRIHNFLKKKVDKIIIIIKKIINSI